ncbi:hypothetical protein HDV00_012157 [Rhizophlyctis rosea]|nr:hypothetical protein HDV00_012157 [Rhizophlyctis rosea]
MLSTSSSSQTPPKPDPTSVQLPPHPTSIESWQSYTPPTDLLTHLTSLPLTQHLRSLPTTTELPFHIAPVPGLIRTPSDWSPHLLRGALLNRPGGLEHALVFASQQHKAVIFIAKLGDLICGHRGLVHGGLIATMFDDLMGSAFFSFVPESQKRGGFTANLNVDYRHVMKAGRVVAFVAWVVEEEGRKVYLRAEARDAEGVVGVGEEGEEGERSIGEVLLGKGAALFAEGKALFVIPKAAPVKEGGAGESVKDNAVAKAE